MIERLLIGDNSFIGVNHLSQEKSRDTLLRLTTSKMADIIEAAFEAGAQGLLHSSHPTMKEVLEVMRSRGYGREFSTFMIVPDMQSSVRIVSERGILGLLRDMLGGVTVSRKAKSIVSGGLSALTFDPTGLLETYLDTEVSVFAKSSPRSCHLKSVFLHEILSELIISFRMEKFMKEYIRHVTDSLHLLPGFATRNFARFIDFTTEIGVPLDRIVILSPFNAVGFQMNPDRESCEEKLRRHPEANVIAMSVFASGYLDMKQAMDYVTRLPVQVSCVVGTSNLDHARSAFPYMQKRLGLA